MAAPTFDIAAGTTETGSFTDISFSINNAANATIVLVVGWNNAIAGTVTASCGGSGMTASTLGIITNLSQHGLILYRANVPAGPTTIDATFSQAQNLAEACAVSALGVTGVGTSNSTTGGNPISLPLTVAATSMIVDGFSGVAKVNTSLQSLRSNQPQPGASNAVASSTAIGTATMGYNLTSPNFPILMAIELLGASIAHALADAPFYPTGSGIRNL